jgi:hypothetical protein
MAPPVGYLEHIDPVQVYRTAEAEEALERAILWRRRRAPQTKTERSVLPLPPWGASRVIRA